MQRLTGCLLQTREGHVTSHLTCLIISVLLATALGAAPAPAVEGRKGMVVSGHVLASQVGLDILKKGGNAVDAAIASGFALAVVLPAAGNIGGGGFMVVRLADGRTTAFDFREKAPHKADASMFLDKEGKYDGKANHQGYRSVAVPGTVAGFFLAHERLGRLPIKDLIEPAIRLAQMGFPVTQKLASDFVEMSTDFRKYPGSRQAFLKGNGETYETGEIWKQPYLARTLERIKKQGREGFYQGKVAGLFAAEMAANAGLIDEADLAAYEATERQPVEGDYRGYRIISMCPPSSGGVALILMLNILEGFDLKDTGYGSALHLHLLTETMRRGFADRARYLGDPDFNPDMPLDRLLSKDYAAQLRRRIRLYRASESDPSLFNGAYESPETTHYAAIDSDGNAVVVTTTLEGLYGSAIAIEGTGFLLNNEMGDFNPVPGETTRQGQIGTAPNLIAPGKRMLSSMTPTLVVKDDRPFLLLGSPGGRTIISTVLQIIVNVVDFGMDIAQAIDAPRVHHQWLPDVLTVEPFSFSEDTFRLLREMGHRVETRRDPRLPYQGRAMGILVDPLTGRLFGASDSRSADGAALGY